MREDKIGEIKCPSVRGAARWIYEFCKGAEEKGYETHCDLTRVAFIPMKTIGTIQPKYYEKPVEIKQWLLITNPSLLGFGGKENCMVVEVMFRDNPPYRGGYDAFRFADLPKEKQEEIKREVKSFIENVLKSRKLPKEAQCEILI
ncbi:MAG: hypothetical protein QW734_09475 [Candidatus Bathyarchaeia archaeon]|uniref:Uncharacterized protein n=1 Tax=Fervidobacterium pennivorans TaxID=93466 RepID=A0A7V4CLS9_FERPE